MDILRKYLLCFFIIVVFFLRISGKLIQLMDKDVRTNPELCHQIQGPTEIFADKCRLVKAFHGSNKGSTTLRLCLRQDLSKGQV